MSASWSLCHWRDPTPPHRWVHSDCQQVAWRKGLRTALGAGAAACGRRLSCSESAGSCWPSDTRVTVRVRKPNKGPARSLSGVIGGILVG